MSRVPRSTILLALAGILWTALAPVHGLILCIGPNGHTEIEFSASGAGCGGCCDDATSTSDRSARDSDCPCVDLPLASGAVDLPRTKPVDVTVVAFTDFAPPPGAVAAPPAALPRSDARRDAPPPPPARHSARSVVLLI